MPWQGNRKWDLFSERNESIHRAQRRLVSHIYSLTIQYEEIGALCRQRYLILAQKTGFHGR